MPSQVRIISPKNSSQWDDLMRGVTPAAENIYGGITNQARADEVRRKIRTAAKHLGLGAKVFWHECPDTGKCQFGADCQFHVSYTAYDMEVARKYKAEQAKLLAASRR